jgi:hypothetical protein
MKPYFLFLLGFSSVVQATTTLDPSQVLQFPVSKDGLTRISIENDGIEDIFAYPSDLEANIQHHKSGHVFIVAEGVQGPMFVTLITKRGVAQDLKLMPTSKTTEPILLKFESEETRTKDNQDHLDSLLKSFMGGSIPKGFYPISLEETSRSSGSLNAVINQGFQNAQYRVLVFDAKAEEGSPQGLDTASMWTEGDLAVSFDVPSLEKGQMAKLYVVQHVK